MPPGKLAPKLFQDFLSFDPVKGTPNILADHTRPVGDGPQLAPYFGSCKHDYAVKPEQSIIPPLDLRPDGSTQYHVAVICKKCRIHANFRVDFTNAANPCPASGRPLHHFQREPTYDQITAERIQYVWQCSASQCRANLFISYRLPRLSYDEIRLLTDTELLKRRYERLVQEDPEREGVRQATIIEPLQRLRKYVKDSLNPEHTKRQFPANNKRFQEAFGLNGSDCWALLERLGFKYADSNWDLPNPPAIQDRLKPDENHTRVVLEDVVAELLAITYQISSQQGLANPAAGEAWPSANRDLERVLAAQGYQRYVSMRRSAAANEEMPYFNSLGALPDMSDTLVEYAFDRQVDCDPEQQAYYLECLQIITESRGTEQLQLKVATLQSTGMTSRRDLRAAYRYLGIPYTEAEKMSEQRIMEQFQAQQTDLGAAAQEEARASLYKIGLARQSTMLINASQQSVDTYEDALTWLGNGVNKDTPDESLLAVVTMKTAESASNEEIALKAIATIARSRQSNLLNNWLLTGKTDGWTMSVDEALRHLNIDQPFDQIDQTILPALFESARQDRPGETTNKAIATIEQAMAGGLGNVPHSPESWPVGLTSHGNTCYLNSLLQYYFSIKPLRDIILSYDTYRLDTAACAEKEERVGQRKISMVEIKGGQRFADDLKDLFHRMITSPDSAVRPEDDLVCRAFLEPKDYALLASSIREEIMNNGQQQTAELDQAEAVNEKIGDLDAAREQLPQSDERHQSDDSSVTLRASANGDSVDVPMKNGDLPPTPPASPRLKGEKDTASDPAPPLPPRRFSTTKEEALAKAQANARQQQDVTEVHDGIMFRLRSGVMPRGKDGDGEQEDALRDLFSIRIVETAINKGVQQRPKYLTDSSIQLNVPFEAIDIYSALDDVFDLQAYAESSTMETFKSIANLPPLLQINIPRIGFDKDRDGGAVYKSNECVALTDDLYLDRYCEDARTEMLPRRRQCWEWRKQLSALRREKKVLAKTSMNMDGPSAILETSRFLSSLDQVNPELRAIGIGAIEADGDITSALEADAREQAVRASSLDGQIDALQKKIDAQFEGEKRIKYRLAAVFFHRGGHGHGHYWIYIHDFHNDMWRSYNDERVEEFKKMEDIFEAKTWQQGTPTYAVYVAAERTDLVQAVCRAPDSKATSTPDANPGLADIEMGGAERRSGGGASSGGTATPETGKVVGDWDDTLDAHPARCE